MNRAYYNEIDPYAAQWLRNLIDEGLIADGDVDERSIEDVAPSDLDGYTQCHFFAGLGGWSHALRLAGIPDDYPVWTGSCPCQPFSAAGKGGGFTDERHLWPAFHWLIEQCRPVVVMGEQVASRDGLAWLDLVSADLEGSGYAVRAADLCAAGVGAPHIRQRLYWMADSGGARLEGRQEQHARDELSTVERSCDADRPGPLNGFWRETDWLFCRDGKWRPVIATHVALVDGLSGTMGHLRPKRETEKRVSGYASSGTADTNQILPPLRGSTGAKDNQREAGGSWRVHAQTLLRPEVHGAGDGQGELRKPKPFTGESASTSEVGMRGMRSDRETARPPSGREPFQQFAVELDDIVSLLPPSIALAANDGRWSDAEALRSLCDAICKAGAVQYAPEQAQAAWASLGEEAKNRIRVDFDVRAWRKLVFNPISAGEPARVGQLRAYGNAIVPQVAAKFIRAVTA